MATSRALASKPYALLAVLVGLLGTLGVTATQTACHSTCSDSEERDCTNKYTECITAASAAADLAACDKCNADYCSCYDACGTTCDKSKLQSCSK